ncbi:hypothetical protein SCA6_020257, partial [Theobroma cacao]
SPSTAEEEDSRPDPPPPPPAALTFLPSNLFEPSISSLLLITVLILLLSLNMSRPCFANLGDQPGGRSGFSFPCLMVENLFVIIVWYTQANIGGQQ